MRWVHPYNDPGLTEDRDRLEACNRQHSPEAIRVLPLKSGNFALFYFPHGGVDNYTFAVATPDELSQAISVASTMRLDAINHFKSLRPSHPAKAPASTDVDALAKLLGDL